MGEDEASSWVEDQTKTGYNLRILEGKKLQCAGIPKRGNWARGDRECGSIVLERPEFEVRGIPQVEGRAWNRHITQEEAGQRACCVLG